MNDRELLELLASDAPAPRAGHVEHVIRRARRTRTGRRVAGAGAVLVVVAGSATVVSGQWGWPAVPLRVLPHVSSLPAAARESDAYLTAIRTVAGDLTEFYVAEGFCEVMRPVPDCRPGLPAQVRADIEAALPGARFIHVEAPVQWPLVRFGEMRRDGEFADIPVSIIRSLKDGQGTTYRLKQADGQWQVTGTVGGSWIA